MCGKETCFCASITQNKSGGHPLNKKFPQLWFLVGIVMLLLVSSSLAQTVARQSDSTNKLATLNPQASNASTLSAQSVVGSLSSLPEADTLIYINPQRLLNDAAPKIMPADHLEKMRAGFADIKKSVGLDPSKIDYLVIAVRFRKPTADLSFVAPDFLIVASGDFSADSLLTVARLSLQQKARDEKYGEKTITLVTIDELAKAAEKNPLLKSFSELGLVSLNANTLAMGNTAYLKAAVDAGEGKGRITTEALNSLLRDQNALISAAGSPFGSFAKSFGLLGTETTPRESRCDSKLGDFYSAVTMDATNFNLRGAMNADNPDTAKIINGLLSGLLQQAVSSVPDKNAQALLKGIKMMAQENEVVWQADIPQQAAADFIREQMKPKAAEAATAEKSQQDPPKRPLRKRRRARKP
jgi:hypothetical protein